MAASTPNDAAAPSRPLDVLLTLNDDEKSFGMSLAQVTSSGGVKWTVISSVFANSAADRAGVCKGYVVRCINDVAMEDKPVAYVASHFRKVRQAKLTLDVGESGGTCNTSTTRGKGGKVTTPSAFDRGHDQGQTVSSKGKAVVLSGKAIAAPGSALAVSNDAAPKQPISKLGAKAAAKSLQMQPRSKGGSPASINGASTRGKKDAGALPSAVGNTEKDMGVVNRTQEVVPRLQRSREQVETETSSSHEGMTITHPEAKTEHCSKGTKNRPRWHEVVSSTKEGTGETLVLVSATPGTSSTESTARIHSVALAAAPPSVSTQISTPALEKSAPLAASPAPVSQKTPTNVTKSGRTSTPARAAKEAARPESVKPSPVDLPELALVCDKSASSPKKVASRSNLQVVTSPLAFASESVITPSKTSKKRSRAQTKSGTDDNVSSKGKSKTKKLVKRPMASNGDSVPVDEDAVNSYVTSDSDLDEPLPRKAPGGRRRERTRHSLTIDRLVGMGFLKEDAEASVKEIGDDPDACMLWIISKIEERQFNEDLNRASIQSEQSKLDEEKRIKKLEKEKLAQTEKFMAVFPTSYMVSPDAEAPQFKQLLQSTIDQVESTSSLRHVLSELMKLESKTIRWYKEASRSYMLQVAQRLDAALARHDVLTCCARASSSSACVFLQTIHDEVQQLTKALFEMPSNQGGVPPVFLACDETTKFDLEDDGFEVVEGSLDDDDHSTR